MLFETRQIYIDRSSQVPSRVIIVPSRVIIVPSRVIIVLKQLMLMLISRCFH